MPTSGVPIPAINNKVFMVFNEEAAFDIVMLFAGSLLANSRVGNTSNATMANKEAMVIDELKKAKRYFLLFNCLGIFAIARNITMGNIK